MKKEISISGEIKNWNKCETCGTILKGKALKKNIRKWIVHQKDVIQFTKNKKRKNQFDKEILEYNEHLLKFFQEKLKGLK